MEARISPMPHNTPTHFHVQTLGLNTNTQPIKTKNNTALFYTGRVPPALADLSGDPALHLHRRQTFFKPAFRLQSFHLFSWASPPVSPGPFFELFSQLTLMFFLAVVINFITKMTMEGWGYGKKQFPFTPTGKFPWWGIFVFDYFLSLCAGIWFPHGTIDHTNPLSCTLSFPALSSTAARATSTKCRPGRSRFWQILFRSTKMYQIFCLRRMMFLVRPIPSESEIARYTNQKYDPESGPLWEILVIWPDILSTLHPIENCWPNLEPGGGVGRI